MQLRCFEKIVIRKKFFTIFTLSIAVAAISCSTERANFCNENADCTDPTRPLCDLFGEYPDSQGVRNVCIASPTEDASDGGVVGGDAGGQQSTFIVSPTAAEFSPQLLGTTSGPKSFSVRNDAEKNEYSISVTIDGSSAFALSSNECVSSIKPMSTCNFEVTFSPSAVGAHEATVTVKGVYGETAITLSGTGSSAALADLSVLFRAPVELVPTFTPDNLNYEAQLPIIAQHVHIQPTTLDPAATIEVDGQTINAETANEPISINSAPKTITINVSAPGASDRVYKVTVSANGTLEQRTHLEAGASSIAIDEATLAISNKVFQRDTNTETWDDETWDDGLSLRSIGPAMDDVNALGQSVAVYNNTVVVGAPAEDNIDGYITKTDSGAAYIFHRDLVSSNWTYQSKLTTTELHARDWFGSSAACSQDIIIVGAPREDSNDETNSGAAYVFRRSSSGGWLSAQRLSVSTPVAEDQFGYSVAVHGDVIAVGSPHNDDNGDSSGAVYIFERDHDEWIFKQQLTTSTRIAYAWFGASVAVDSDVVVVGAPQIYAGGAYVFRRDEAGNWNFEQRLSASTPAEGDQFGYSVAVHGDVITIGVPYEDTTKTDSGAAYIFRRDANDGTWKKEQELKSNTPNEGALFGSAVAVGDHDIAVSTSSMEWSTYLFR